MTIKTQCARSVALQGIVETVLNKKSLSINEALLNSAKEISLAKALAFGTIRYYHRLNNIITTQLTHPMDKEDLDVHAILLLGAYQLLFSRVPTHAAIFQSVELCKNINKIWAKKLVNGVLRNIERQKDKLLAMVDYSHPSWLIKKIKQAYPQQYQTILAQNNQQAPMSLRIKPSCAPSQYQAYLKEKDIQAKTLDLLPQALVLKSAVNVHHLPDFDQGVVYVQDGSAQLAGHILSPNNNTRILDACAAPGGKTLHLAEIAPNASITALESDSKRLERLEDNIKQHNSQGGKYIEVVQGLAQTQDWWDGRLFDKILLDVPCSATGVIRRHPDIKLLRKAKDIAQLVELQAEILTNTWAMLKPGGSLLYATCSILPAENTQQMANFLQNHTDAIEVQIPILLGWGMATQYGKQQIPHQCFDGFYYCLLQKKKIAQQ